MSYDFTEHHKRKLVSWVENHHLAPEVFITFDLKTRDVEEFESKMRRLLVKTSKYSKSHIGAVGGYERSPDRIHGHLVVLTETGKNSLKKGFLDQRWSIGKTDERYFDSSEKTSAKLATFYALNHELQVQFRDFCPNPRKCCSDFCAHSRKKR